MINLSELYKEAVFRLLGRRRRELAAARGMLESVTQELSLLYGGIIKVKLGKYRLDNELIGYADRKDEGVIGQGTWKKMPWIERMRILRLSRDREGVYYLHFLNSRDATLVQPYIDTCRSQGLEIRVNY